MLVTTIVLWLHRRENEGPGERAGLPRKQAELGSEPGTYTVESHEISTVIPLSTELICSLIHAVIHSFIHLFIQTHEKSAVCAKDPSSGRTNKAWRARAHADEETRSLRCRVMDAPGGPQRSGPSRYPQPASCQLWDPEQLTAPL